MSTKDLLDRLQQTKLPTQTRRRTGAGPSTPPNLPSTPPPPPTSPVDEKADTRVGARVIRRRGDEPKGGAPAPTAAETARALSSNAPRRDTGSGGGSGNAGSGGGSGNVGSGGGSGNVGSGGGGRGQGQVGNPQVRQVVRRPTPSAVSKASPPTPEPVPQRQPPVGPKKDPRLGSAVIGLPEGYKTPEQRRAEAEEARHRAEEEARQSREAEDRRRQQREKLARAAEVQRRQVEEAAAAATAAVAASRVVPSSASPVVAEEAPAALEGGPAAEVQEAVSSMEPPVVAEVSPTIAAPVPEAVVPPAPPPAAPVVEGPKRTETGKFVPMGLGRAVIGLPEGYDPSNPQRSPQRSREGGGRPSGGRPAQSNERPAPRGEQGGRGPGPAGGQAPPQSPPPNVERGPGEQRSWREERVPTAPDMPGEGAGRDRRRGGARGEQPARGRVVQQTSGFQPPKSVKKKKGAAKKASPQAKAIKRRVTMENDTITVSELAHAMSVKAGQVIRSLLQSGVKARINDTIDMDTARIIAEEFEYEVIDGRFDEEEHLIDVAEDETDLVLRDPVVTIMGHVDHGKTTLLDTIRRANVAEGEAGGITQHISAYQVIKGDRTITFIDTPGHAAFTHMRARGALVTDIVILVVAADDGVMPQTIEALNHAKAAGVQIMVAVNKCDKPGANPARVRQELMAHHLVAEDFGGETIFVDVSALRGDGIDDLLESVLLLSEVGEYRANPERHAQGYVLEARLEKGRGAVATLLVKHGTLKQGDSLVLGTVWGRVRAMNDYKGDRVTEAGPSMPVEIIGLQDVPNAGDAFVVVESDKDARALAEHRLEEERQRSQSESSQPVTIEQLMKRKQAGEVLTLNLIIKSDVGGTLEAMKGSMDKIKVDGTEVKVLHAAIGAISESDVTLAHTYGGVIIGFNVRPDSKARQAISEYAVEVRTYKIIYEALEDIEKALRGMLAPQTHEVIKGYAEILQTFNVPKVGTIAGCRVNNGTIARSHSIRLLRDGVVMWTGRLASLRRFKDDVREVSQGFECGMNLDGFNDIKIGDELESFLIEEVGQEA